jgi:hypothetical protein
MSGMLSLKMRLSLTESHEGVSRGSLTRESHEGVSRGSLNRTSMFNCKSERDNEVQPIHWARIRHYLMALVNEKVCLRYYCASPSCAKIEVSSFALLALLPKASCRLYRQLFTTLNHLNGSEVVFK